MKKLKASQTPLRLLMMTNLRLLITKKFQAPLILLITKKLKKFEVLLRLLIMKNSSSTKKLNLLETKARLKLI